MALVNPCDMFNEKTKCHTILDKINTLDENVATKVKDIKKHVSTN